MAPYTVMRDKVVLGLETGGTKLVAGVAGSDWRIRRTVMVRRGSADRARASFRHIVDAAEQLLLADDFANLDLAAVGFGFGGTVRRSTNRPQVCLHEDGWDQIDVARELHCQFGVPVWVENDCKLAALAEAHFGAGRGAESVFYVTLGTGVGGGYVRQGRILTLGDLGEAEIGHVQVYPDGPICPCGNKGCVEAVFSGPGLAGLSALLAQRHPDQWQSSPLGELESDRPVGSEGIVRAWESGDGFSTMVMQYAATGLASALAATVNLLVPDRIVIGGGLGTSSNRLPELVQTCMEPMIAPYFRGQCRVVGSQLGNEAVTQGAAILAFQRIDALT